jgi:hypothetical protein
MNDNIVVMIYYRIAVLTDTKLRILHITHNRMHTLKIYVTSFPNINLMISLRTMKNCRNQNTVP